MAAEEEPKRILFLLRHAKADRPAGTPDHERPLNTRGCQDLQLVGEYAARQKWMPHLILASTSCRTRQTAELFVQYAGITCPIECMDELYLATVPEIFSAMATVPPEITSLLIVGHNPGFEQLVASLRKDDHSSGSYVPTATLVRIELANCVWPADMLQNARVSDLITPAWLKSEAAQ